MAEQNNALPLLALRGLLVYPTMVIHLDVGREKSLTSIEKAIVNEQLIVLATQKEIQTDDPGQEDMYRIGTLAKVKQMFKLPNDTVRVLVEGLRRVEIVHYEQES